LLQGTGETLGRRGGGPGQQKPPEEEPAHDLTVLSDGRNAISKRRDGRGNSKPLDMLGNRE